MNKLIVCAKTKGGASGAVHLGGNWTLSSSSLSVSVMFNLNRIEYDRKVFAPCSLSLRFTAVSPSRTVTKILQENVFAPDKEYSVELYDIKSSSTVHLARNYFIQSAQVRAVTDNDTECTLKCFSCDRHIQEKKGCQAFTSKMFGSQIFELQLKSDARMKDKYDFNMGRLLMMGYDSSVKYRDGHHTVSVNGEQVRKPGHDTELIHPYLVRYNESLYDFMARIAHRCGEFMFFEDGKLCLGLPSETVSHIIEGTRPSGILSPFCTYSGLSEDSYDNGSQYSTDYVNGINEMETAQESGSRFDAEYTSDEYLHRVELSDAIKDTGGWWIYRGFGALFTSSNFILGMIAGGLVTGVNELLSKGTIPLTVSKITQLVHVNPITNNVSSELSNPENGTAQNLCNRFYHIIERLEEKSLRQTVKMDFSSEYPELKLGEDVALDDGVTNWCVITRLSGYYSYEDNNLNENHQAEGVPVLSDAGIDALKHVVVPPAGLVSHKMESQPHDATVVRNDDPLRLNRVRVKYPWQKANSDATPWIRVTVPFAGSPDSSGGVTMTPEVGEQVVVDYYDGNIERPYVDGSFYFRFKGGDGLIAHSPSQGLTPHVPRIPQTMDTLRVPHSIVSANGHSISFLDMPDTSWFSTAIPMIGTLTNLCKIPAFMADDGNFQDVPVGKVNGGGVMLKDGTGVCSVTISADNRSVSVKSDFGTVKMTAFQGIDIYAPNGDVAIVGKNVEIEAGNKLSLVSGTNIRPKKANKKDVAGIITGSVLTKIGFEALKTSTGIKFSGALDLSFIRSILEMVLRPVEGTLTLKSNRNTIMTAGEGEVTVPDDMLSDVSVYKLHRLKGEWSPMKSRQVLEAMDRACSVVDQFYIDIRKYLKDIKKLADDIQARISYSEFFIKPDTTKKYEKSNRVLVDAYNGIMIKYTDFFTVDDPLYNEKYERLEKDYSSLVSMIKSYLKMLDSLQQRLDKSLKPLGLPSVSVQLFPENYIGPLPDAEDNDDPDAEDDNAVRVPYKLDDHSFRDPDFRKKVMKRAAVLQIVRNCEFVAFLRSAEKEHDLGKIGDYKEPSKYKYLKQWSDLVQYCIDGTDDSIDYTHKWSDVADSIIVKPEDKPEDTVKQDFKYFGQSALKGALSVLSGGGDYSFETNKWKVFPNIKKLFNVNGISGPRAFYNISDNGGILFSFAKERTLGLDSNNSWKSYPNYAEAIAAKIIALGLD